MASESGDKSTPQTNTGLSRSSPPSLRAEQVRRSPRLQAKDMAKKIFSDIDVVSQYHLLTIKELDSNPSLDLVRLREIHSNLTQQSNMANILAQYEELRSLDDEEASQQVKSVLTAIDRVSADQVNVVNRVKQALERLTTKPRGKSKSLAGEKSHPPRSRSGKSHKSNRSQYIVAHNDVEAPTTVSSYESGSRHSSRSSRLADMALQSRALLAEKEARLVTEMQTIRMEEQMAELEKQKEAVKRSIRMTQTQGELDAEKRKHQVLLEALEEEIEAEQMGSLLQRPSILSKQLQSHAEPDLEIPQSKEETLKSESVIMEQQNQSMDSTKPVSIQPIVRAQSEKIAQEITDHLHISLVAPPEPGKFSGDPLEYAGWKVAFDGLIGSKKGTPLEKLHRLRNYVKGDAYEAISGYFCLQSSDAYREALNTLHEEFGREDMVEESLRDKIETWPKISPRDYRGLKSYSYFLKQCLVAQSCNSELKVLDQKRENRKFIKALPDGIIARWTRQVTESEEKGKGCPPFSNYVKFVALEAKVATNNLRDQPTSNQPQTTKQVQFQKSKTVFHTTTEKSIEPKIVCAFCNAPYHSVLVCRKLTKLSQAEKEEFVQSNRLCFSCLESGHRSKQCTKKAQCEICQKPHPTSMHLDQPFFKRQIERTPTQNYPVSSKPDEKTKPENSKSTTQLTHSIVRFPSEQQESESESTDHVTHSSTSESGARTSSMTLPVWVSSAEEPNEEILVYALLDTQSDSSYITDEIAAQVSAKKEEATINLSTMTSTETTQQCMKLTDIRIRGLREEDALTIKSAYTSKSIPAVKDHIPTADMISRWPHLRNIANQMELSCSIPVGLLIGYDTPIAFKPSECVSGDENEPYGVKTPLGWVIMGALNNSATPQKVSHRIAAMDLTQEVKPITLTQKPDSKADMERIIKVLSQDFSTQTGPPTSMDDRRFLDTLHNGVHQDQEGYVTMPLPMKTKPQAVNSRFVALHRFNLLRSKMKKDQAYREQYQEFMDGVINRGEAEKVPEGDKSAQAWYLPHFGVYHPKKPNKIRVVFDASAKVNGICLNDHLLEGPDHINNLHGILVRFRKERVAIMCDIERMFHNFRVSSADRDYFRFLWYDEYGEINDYRMKVHIFGAKSSPGCATFGLHYLATTSEVSEDVKAFVAENFYVDDGVISVESTVKAKELIEGARKACRAGNIRLHKFVSNDIAALEDLPITEKTENATKIDLCTDLAADSLTERALGLQWDIKEDAFKFQTTDSNKPPTRRGILSTVASLFDPLGLVSPFILQGKSILQALCKDKVEWDTPLDQNTEKQWSEWKQNMASLCKLKIPRCYKPSNAQHIVTAEIHNFSDASTTGYGQCSYLRLIDEQGDIHISLLMSKARVAPLKVVSIPRLELQAACTSVDVSRFLKEQLQMENIQEFYWTDSKVVLAYINNDAKRFQVYVSNRVQKIRDYTEPQQWFYVPTDMNPADLASRGATPQQLANSCWFDGPEFLKQEPVHQMSSSDELVLDESDPEVKRTVLGTYKTPTTINERFKSFSRWRSAIRAITWLEQCVRRKRNQTLDRISAEQKAKQFIIKEAQQLYFRQEIIDLRHDKPLKVSSSLRKLCPFLDENGILRVGGRLQESSMDYSEKHPIILPKESHISKMIIDFYHEKAAHQGRGFTLAKLRASGFWIIGAHSMIASTIHHCVICRKHRGKVEQQQMAPLPSDRTEASPPFSYVGIDCFGPFTTKDGRKETKCWGLLVTCMASRAVHLEILTDMTTDTFLNALRTVIAIRGNIRQIRCDRGTNFVGAITELISSAGGQRQDLGVEFVFNPPHASHMGGAWERHIRTVRSVLKDVARKYGGRFSTSTLRVAFYEIMAIINCRPLSAVSEEETPLTPNMLLTMKSEITLPPPGKFEDSDVYSRKRWIQVQSIANQFWNRYRKAYLSQLQSRGKWVRPRRSMKVGDIVSVNEGDCMRSEWKIARVVDTKTSADGLVRSVRLRVSSGSSSKSPSKPVFLERPVSKLILLVEAD